MNPKAFLEVKKPTPIGWLPTDRRGYPIPYFATAYANGAVDFTTVNKRKWWTAIQQHLCGVCGRSLHGLKYFVGGPRSVENRLFSDLPMHEGCAKYALQVCPFIALPKMSYRPRPEGEVSGMFDDTRPDRYGLGAARHFDLVELGGETVLHPHEWAKLIEWWKDGKPTEANDADTSR